MTAEETTSDVESQQAAAGESLLARHTSPLPNLLYILSFAPPLLPFTGTRATLPCTRIHFTPSGSSRRVSPSGPPGF